MAFSQFLNRGSNAAGTRSSLVSKFGKMGPASLAFSGIDIATRMHDGDDFGTAVAKTAGSAVLWGIAPVSMFAYTGITGAYNIGASYMNFRKRQVDWWRQQHIQGSLGGGYADTAQAQTMRQAAVQAIQNSKLNARSALGGEAQLFNQNQLRSR